MDSRLSTYWRADGIYSNVRLNPERSCMLVITGRLEDGAKELIAVWDGIRERKESCREVMRDLKTRGLADSPKLAVGGLDLLAALEEEYPRLSGRALKTHPDDESDRISVRNGAAPNPADERPRLENGDLDDGLPAGASSGAVLEKTQRIRDVDERHRGRNIHRRRH